MDDNTVHINLCGAVVTLLVLAQIANALESGKTVTVSNAAIPANGVGVAAFMQGQASAYQDMEDLRSRVDYIEGFLNV